MKFLAICCLFAAATFAQKDPNYAPNRNTIVHLFEWKFKDVQEECLRFLQYKGYGGVQLSPVNENMVVTNRPWWERYQPISYKIATRSGTEKEFIEMSRNCNNFGVRIYIDIIINHMGRNSTVGTGGSTADPDNKDFPAVPYTPENFHETCQIEHYDDPEEVRNCELEYLKDLDQGQNYVQEKILDFLNHLVDLGVAGFRVDAAKHMEPKHLEYIYSQVKNLSTDYGFAEGTRPYFYQEVIDYGGEAISRSEYTDFGAVTEFKYGRELGRVFKGLDKLTYLENWGPEWGLIEKSQDALVFIDNHDNQRGHGGGKDNVLTYKEPKQYKMAIAFMLAHPYGTTRIMSSFDFTDNSQGPPQDSNQNIISPSINADDSCGNGWICEHRWRQIYNMIAFRHAARDYAIENWWSNGDQQIAFSRGNAAFIAFTNYGDIDLTLQTGLSKGKYCDIISGNVVQNNCTGKTIEVGNDGKARIVLRANEEDGVIATHAHAKLEG